MSNQRAFYYSNGHSLLFCERGPKLEKIPYIHTVDCHRVKSRHFQATQLHIGGVHCRESKSTGPEVHKVGRVTGVVYSGNPMGPNVFFLHPPMLLYSGHMGYAQLSAGVQQNM